MNKLYLEICKVAYIFLTKLLLSSLANLAPFRSSVDIIGRFWVILSSSYKVDTVLCGRSVAYIAYLLISYLNIL